jgi:predicted kinase
VATLYLLLGVQGSGKSTWAAANAARLAAVVVASDEIRNQLEAAGVAVEGQGDRVFAAFEARVAELLDAGRNVIADATHVRRQWREKTLALARQRGARVVVVWFDLPLAVCLARNAAKPGGAWGQRPAAADFVTSLWQGLEPPEPNEADEILKISA